ncbi:MAG: DUF2490 domain-containing protein [Cyanobacteria bacterium TGS_CYA1]|nr:DUF2490 domain-containing protein [Cyanobacteria bacterium TGS_CYA1]
MSIWRKNILALTLALMLMLGVTKPSYAGIEHDLQLWTPVTLDARLYRNLRGYLEINPRIGDNITQMSQLLIRPALQYRVNEGCSLFAGYLWGTTYLNGDVLHEHRLWEQVLFDKDIKRFSIINRTRLEQRMFPHLADTGNRLRHMLKLEYDLNSKLYLVASDELFVNLNSVKNGPQAGIDQNRIFAGVGLRPLKRTRIEAGYQYQWINRTDQFDQGNHAILIQTFIGIKD